MAPERLERLLEPHRDDLARWPLYISLDKDVMNATDAVVNWDSGHLGLGEVRDVLGGFIRAANCRMAGMDIVGDWSFVSVKGWLRQLLHYTEHPLQSMAPHEALVINDRTNQLLFETLGTLGVYNVAASRRAAS
jgi:hypothetical protein